MASGTEKKIVWDYIGAVRYADGLGLQESLHGRVRAGADGFLLMLEHYPVVTDGRFGRGTNFLLTRAEMEKRGVEVYSTGRGGNVTFHGPGQLVSYPVIDLRAFNLGARSYVRALEEALIRLLRGLGIEGERREGYPGVWVGEGKIASVGVSVKNGVTMHGCALNVNTDLSYFSMIVPCGIEGAAVTSIQNILGEKRDVVLVAESFARVFADVIGVCAERDEGGEGITL